MPFNIIYPKNKFEQLYGTTMILVLGEKQWTQRTDVLCVDFENKEGPGLRLTENGSGMLLEIVQFGEWIPVDGVIWRGQLDVNPSLEYSIASMVMASEVPCVNPIKNVILYANRISSYGALKKVGLPVIPINVLMGKTAISYFHTPEFPSVLKVGNWHMDYGKMRILNHDQWLDAVDMAAVMNDFITNEPYITYKRDVRALMIGKNHFSFERKSDRWKANVNPEKIKQIDTPNEIKEHLFAAANTLGMEVLGVDFIEDKNGKWHIIDINSSPGLVFEEWDFHGDVNRLMEFKKNEKQII